MLGEDAPAGRAKSAAQLREAALRNVLEVISRSRDDEKPVFDVILESAARLCDAPIARLELANETRSHFKMAAAWGEEMRVTSIGEEWPLDLPHIVPTTIREARAHLVPDLADTEEYRAGDRIRKRLVDEEGMRSYLTAPLVSGGTGIGCIVLSRRHVQPFTEDDRDLLDAFAAQAVIAIENVRQFRELERLNGELGARVEAQVAELARLARLKRFLPPQVAEVVVTRGEQMLSSHRALIAALFCDLRGFTAFCERAEPEEAIEVLQSYHEEMGRLLDAHGAGVDHRSGDGIMAIFNDPLPCDDPAGDALRLALAMRARMESLCAQWRRLGHRLGFGVGVSFGYATMGMVGSEGRRQYTASGTVVNLASRLCDRAEDGEILLSPRAAAALEAEFALEPHGEVTLKGLHEPVPVRRVAVPDA
ncbi:GAF domain-containing protein [Pikeienuella piscinae]|uniref:GAF domain-containing protein n=1 Tax=Pikeienuella piscinae TaxID=2748098 RepID=A0A7L5C4R6_9RHOB|nr:adenylate/guanylate cyclase domain-containing protein [Pikeienuella piscinae]QIE56929.1 GAF domain-containing protein [Pikeienuella piscinae]